MEEWKGIGHLLNHGQPVALSPCNGCPEWERKYRACPACADRQARRRLEREGIDPARAEFVRHLAKAGKISG